MPHDEERTSRRKRFADPAISAKAKAKLFKFLAIDRASPSLLFDANTKASGAAFLREVAAIFARHPFKKRIEGLLAIDEPMVRPGG